MIESFCLCTNKNNKFKEIIRYKNESVFSNYKGTIIGQCVNCGLLKTFPCKKNKVFNPKKSKVQMYQADSDKFIKLFAPVVNKVKKYKKHGRILDVGCSSGLLLTLLKKQGYDITGIEPNITAYKKARAKLGKQIFYGTLFDYMSKYNKKFDLIIYNHVIEHIEQVNQELKLVNKILKKGGILIIGVPNTSNIVFYLRGKYWESLMPNEHIWHFSASYLEILLKKYGFQVIDKSFYHDKRPDYPLLKRFYFKTLCIINKIFNTGEAVLLLSVKI